MSRGRRGGSGRQRTGDPSDEEILSALAKASSPLKGKELARRLRVGTHGYRAFRDRLRDLVKRGRVVRVKGNRFSAASDRTRVRGNIEWIRSGDAFLLRRDAPDVFIPSENLAGALDGDLVVAEVETDPRGRRPLGAVVEVVRRSTRPVVGVFQQWRASASVVPRRGPAIAIRREWTDDAQPGDVVAVEIIEATRRQGPLGRVVRVIGRSGDAQVERDALRAEHGLGRPFPAEVLAEARAMADEPIVLDPGREDRRELHVVVIDPEDARDHDDALSVRDLGDGSIEVGIHIADVSHYVRSGSALDREAYDRGTSVYLVDGVIPMLPDELSGDVCSLIEGQDRRAMSLFVVFGPDFVIRDRRLERTLVRAAEALDYRAAQAILDGADGRDPGTRWSLETLGRVAKILRKRREDRGSLDLDLPEARVEVDEAGTPTRILRRERYDSHRLIEELMVLANELVAVEALRRGWPVLYRSHEPPDADKLDELRQLVSVFGYELERPATPASLQRLLDDSRGTAGEAAVHFAVLRSLKKADYAHDRSAHFGLASKAYTHFTSPIRRYPDLHLHRVLASAWLDGASPAARCGPEELPEAASALSFAERRADAAQRDSVDLARVQLMASKLGEVFSGWISSVQPFGFFVRLHEQFVDGLVHVESLTDDYYELHRGTGTLVGANAGRTFRVGDPVSVQVARVDRTERRIDFVLSASESGAAVSARGFDALSGQPYPPSNKPPKRPKRR